jgi:hypothetical protein
MYIYTIYIHIYNIFAWAAKRVKNVYLSKYYISEPLETESSFVELYHLKEILKNTQPGSGGSHL